MAENDPFASAPDSQQAPGLHLVAPSAESRTAARGDHTVLERRAGAARAVSRSTCTGKVTWMTVPDRDVSECVLPRGHRGDHRDAGGYPWNEGRWLD
jgi:hypothetical protein